ncbi:MAG: SEC-C metal-binding domain-containing protein, partial [Ignavibacteriae bacterium]|nr:SEC-C metal-binding domain-containing protein [Ignavibacteriota bacterium]
YKKTHKRKLSNIYENYDYFADQYSEYEDYEDDILHTEKNGNIHDISESVYHEEPLYKAGRNEPCPCGSGKKFKKCHGLK